MRRFCSALVVAALVCGCTTVTGSVPSAGWVVIAGVPDFQEQTRGDDCAGVALASLLGHAGFAVTAAQVDAAVYEPRLGGALLPDLERFAASVGAQPHSGRGREDELRQLIHAGRPVLVPIDLGWSLWRRPHYVVLYGSGAEGFLMHLRHGESGTMAREEFERRWTLMGRLYLYLER